MSLGTAAHITKTNSMATSSTAGRGASAYVDFPSAKMPDYLRRIRGLQQDQRSPYSQATIRSLRERDENLKDAVKPPKVQITDLKLNPDPTIEKFTPAFEQPGKTLSVLHILAKGIDNKELVSAIKNFRQEQRALQGATA